MLNVIPDDDTNDTDAVVDKVAKKTISDINDIDLDREHYQCCIDKDVCSMFPSDTLSDLLSNISKKLNQSLPALLIGDRSLQ